MKDFLLQMCSEGEVMLYYCIDGDDPTGIDHVIERGTSVNTFFHSHHSAWSALHLCAEKGRYRCAERLLKLGADVNSTDTWGQSPLMYAVVSEWLDLVDLFVRHAANVDQADSNGHTPLHQALNCSNMDCLQTLCQAGADVNKRDVLGRSPLWHVASEDGHVDRLVYLLGEGADATLVDAKDKFTPLQAAVWYADQDQAEYVSLLLEAGGSGALSPPRSDNTALMTLVQRNWCVGSDISEEEARLTTGFIQAGCDVDACSLLGLYKGTRAWHRIRQGTALKIAAHRGAATMVSLLLEAGADPDIQDAEGVTALHVAVYYNHLHCARLLLAANANLHLCAKLFLQNQAQPLYQMTPFSCALSTCNPAMVKLLLQAGYRVDKVQLVQQQSATMLATGGGGGDELFHWLLSTLGQAETLKVMCRRTLRHALGRNIVQKTQHLPLPTLLKQFVLLQDVLG